MCYNAQSRKPLLDLPIYKIYHYISAHRSSGSGHVISQQFNTELGAIGIIFFRTWLFIKTILTLL